MKENGFFKRRQSIIKAIVFGFVLLVVCLWVCVSQISLLENTYKQEVSQDFYNHHTRSASAIDEIFNRVYIEAKNGGKMLGNKNYEYGDDRIYDVIKMQPKTIISRNVLTKIEILRLKSASPVVMIDKIIWTSLYLQCA